MNHRPSAQPPRMKTSSDHLSFSCSPSTKPSHSLSDDPCVVPHVHNRHNEPQRGHGIPMRRRLGTRKSIWLSHENGTWLRCGGGWFTVDRGRDGAQTCQETLNSPHTYFFFPFAYLHTSFADITLLIPTESIKGEMVWFSPRTRPRISSFSSLRLHTTKPLLRSPSSLGPSSLNRSSLSVVPSRNPPRCDVAVSGETFPGANGEHATNPTRPRRKQHA
jgi:hypothetical protein